MKILNVEQGSPEWLRLRREKIGASEIAAVCGKSPYMKPWELWEQKIMGTHTYENEHMRRGKEVEQSVRANHYPRYQPIVAIADNYDWMLASYDGYNLADNSVIEIKTVSQDEIDRIMKGGKLPIHWQYQAMQLMLVNNLKFITFVICQKITQAYYEVPFYFKDYTHIAQDIITEGIKFYVSLIKGVPIPRPEIDEDISILDDCEERWSIKMQIKELEERAHVLDERLKEKAKDKSLKCGDYTYRRSLRKGSIDYSGIPELKGIDLDAYRRPETVIYTLVKE